MKYHDIAQDSNEAPDPNDGDSEYEFILKYELMVGQSDLFAELYGRGIDVLSYFLENPGQIKIDTKAQVSMNYIEYLGVNAANRDRRRSYRTNYGTKG